MRRLARFAATAAAVVATALVLSACSGGGATTPNNEKVTLTYWGGTGTEKAIAEWNKTHPNVQVKAVNVTNGQPATTKLLTAMKAGNGAPDVMSTEYSNFATFASDGVLADVSKYGASDLKSKYASSVWNSVTLGGASVYGVPIDAGPMMFYYRKDVFQKLGLSVPTTWDEYAADAKKIHAADPSEYLGTFNGADASVFAGLTQQAGSSWWSQNGKSWSVNIDSATNKKVASYWGGLVQSGDIATTPLFSPEWNSAINNGSQVGWISAVWGGNVLGGVGGNTKGDWAAAPLPNWDQSKPSSGNWGGQAAIVTTQSKHPEQAYELAKWLGTSKTGLQSLAKNVGIYPAATDKQGTTDTPPAFLSDQKDFYDIAATSLKDTKPVTYGPNVTVAYNAYVDAFGAALKSKQQADFVSALTQLQATTTADLKKTGFSVK